MNQKTFSKIRNLKSLINFNSLSGNKENMLCINSNEKEEHLNKKFEVCKYLKERDFTFYTEVIFKNNKRADIVAISNLTGEGLIVEIVDSEKEDSINKKINDYDINFELIFIKVNEKVEERLTI